MSPFSLGILGSARVAAGTAPLFTFTYGGRSTFPANASSTFTSVPLGSASTGRQIIVAVSFRASQQARLATYCTVAGVDATKDLQSSTSYYAKGSIWRADVPTGTSGTVVIGGDGVAVYNDCEVAVYSCPNPVSVVSAVASTGPTLTTASGGFYIAAAAAGRLSEVVITTTNFESVDSGTVHKQGSGATTGANVTLSASPLTSGSIAGVAYQAA